MTKELSDPDFDRFFADHYRRTLGVVFVLTGSVARAEDAVHEAVARAWERRARIERLDRWILTTAMNLARNRWRNLRREVVQAATPTGLAPDSDNFSLDVRRAIARLPLRQRQAVVLHYVLDLPVAEIADFLALSPGGVKHALFRGRASLAAALAPQSPREEAER